MKRKSSVFYINIVLSLVAVLLVVNVVSPTGHELIKRALATVGAITGEGTLNYVARFAGAQSTSNFIGNSIIYDSGSYIGIGSGSPNAKLHIYGTNGIGSEVRIASSDANTLGTLSFYEVGTAAWKITGPGANGRLTI